MSAGQIPRPCKICRRLTLNMPPYCDEHKKVDEEREKLWDQRRGSRHARGYDNLWVKVRKMYLILHPLCEMCEAEGRIIPAQEVHHKVALRDGGARLDSDNLMAVCRSCHHKLTQEEIRRRRGSAI